MAENEIVKSGTQETELIKTSAEFNEMLPRSIYATPYIRSKTGSSAGFGGMSQDNLASGGYMGSNNIMRNPSRRFYDPRYTATSMYMPRSNKDRNMWNRWFYDHDPLTGAVLDLHAELPHSQAEFLTDDPIINRHINECVDRINLFSKLPQIDLEYMKIGEVFIHTPWNKDLMMWEDIIIHNPDYIEVTYSPFAERESLLELIPSEELKKIVYSTKPEDQQLKRRIPVEILKRVLTGKNILLNNKEVTHIARKSNPTDERGSSILQRLYRCHVPGTLVRMEDGTKKVIEEVNKGDFVLSLNGEKREVLDTVNYDIDDKIIKLTIEKNSNPIMATKGHEFLVRKQYCACGCGEEIISRSRIDTKFIHSHNLKTDCSHENSETRNNAIKEPIYKIEKIKIENIKEGHQLLVPINNEVKECNLTEGMARLLGYYMAEGCISGENKHYQKRVEFTFGLHERDTWVEDVRDILEKDFEISPYIYPGPHGKKVCAIRISRVADFKKLIEFLNDNLNGRMSWNKEFTEKVLYYPKNIQEQILIGLFRGDGSKDKRSIMNVTLGIVSKEMSEQVQWMLFRCGYFNNITFEDKKPRFIFGSSKITNFKRVYYTRITGNDAKKFRKMCWNEEDKKIEFENTEIYRTIKEYRDKGLSLTAIAKELNNQGIKGQDGGYFYNRAITNILKNGGMGLSCNQFDKGRIQKDENYFYVPIRKIEEIPYKGKVYDITVDVNHWWLADGCFVNSNTYMLEDKYHEFQQTTVDSMMYPLKIFKLGDPNKGWIPAKEHQEALAQMLSQANMDPNFSLIYHYGLQTEVFSVVDKLMKLDTEWQNIDKRKMAALGVNQAFIENGGTYSSANVGLQIQLAKYKAKRDLFETQWLQDKFFKVMAERNGWYTRDKREIVGQYRVKRSEKEQEQRLVIPKIIWHKKLMMRDDQSYLNFLNNVYAAGKGPISTITLLMQMGLNLEDELTNKKKQKTMEDRIGEYIHPPVEKAAFNTSASKTAEIPQKKGFFDKFKIGKDKEVEVKQVEEPKNLIDLEALKKELENPENKSLIESAKKDFVGQTGNTVKVIDKEEALEREHNDDIKSTREVNLVDNQEWYKNIQSPNISSEVIMLLTSYIKKLTNVIKKYDNFSEGIDTEKNDIMKLLSELYLQGKLTSYSHTNYLPIQKEVYSNKIQDYSDIMLFNEFEEWIGKLLKIDVTKDSLFKIFRDLSNTCYSYGQLKGFKEQGIENAKVFNVLRNEGLQYPVNQLLNKGWTLSNVISPNSEIIILIPCIEGYENNGLDPHIKKQVDMTVNDINIKNCPVEHAAFFERFINKFGKYVKRKYATITFTNDVIDLKEWEEDTIARFEKTSSDKIIIQNKVLIEKTAKMHSVASFTSGKDLFISNWIFKNESLVTDSLINLINIYDEVEKPVNKVFKEASYDLATDEIDTYRLLNYIEPISDEKETIYGWKISEFIPKDTDYRLINGKVWDIKGKCSNRSRSAMQIFNDNIKLWLFYPQRMDDNIKKYFELL